MASIIASAALALASTPSLLQAMALDCRHKKKKEKNVPPFPLKSKRVFLELLWRRRRGARAGWASRDRAP